jgi:hypothetical protein
MRKNILKVIMIMVVMTFILQGCQFLRPNPTSENKAIFVVEPLPSDGYYGVYRITDEEAGVVCWLHNHNGISCLPISQTNLEK